MSGIGGVRLSGLSPNPVEPSNDNPVKLKGIVWNDKVNGQGDNLRTDTNNVNVRNNGPVPSNDDLPVLFNDDNTPAQQTNNRKNTETKPEYTTKKDEGMATGIGMVVGAVTGGVVGSYLGKSSGTKLGLKLGIAVGVAVGGYVGHRYE